jgi:transposase
MVRGTLLPSASEVKLVCLRPRVVLIEVEFRTSCSFSSCPVCGTAWRRVHSRYVRRLGSFPWDGIPVSILLQTRRFFCVVESCRRRIFTESLGGTVLRYSRRTLRSCVSVCSSHLARVPMLT